MAMHPRKGILNIDVLSFNRLAYRVFEEVGGNTRPILEETGKSLVLQKVIGEQQKKLKVLGTTLKKSGSVAQMKSLVSEFLQYQVKPEDIESWLEGQEDKKLLAWKLDDVKNVYQEFTNYLSEKYLTAEEVPEVLCDVIEKSAFLKGSTIVLDGFTGFTPVQNQVIQKLYRLCEELYVVVTFDPREEGVRNDGPHRLFHMSRQMMKKLVHMARETGTEVLSTDWVLPGEKSRFAGNEPLHFLEQNLFRYGRNVYEKEQQRIAVWEGEDPAEELNHVAGTILRLVRDILAVST